MKRNLQRYKKNSHVIVDILFSVVQKNLAEIVYHIAFKTQIIRIIQFVFKLTKKADQIKIPFTNFLKSEMYSVINIFNKDIYLKVCAQLATRRKAERKVIKIQIMLSSNLTKFYKYGNFKILNIALYKFINLKIFFKLSCKIRQIALIIEITRFILFYFICLLLIFL